jgi:dipeptidyl aminopeptidase/acylaminoacyl peptidase
MTFPAVLVAALAAVAPVAGRGAVPPIGDYGKLPAVEQVRLSPSGEKLVVIAVVADQRRVIVKPIVGDPLFAISAGILKLRYVDWLGDGHILIESSNTLDDFDQRSEAAQSTIVNVTTGKTLTVFQDQVKIFHATFGFEGFVAKGQTQYAFFRGLTLGGSGNSVVDFDRQIGYMNHSHTDLYKVDVDTGLTSLYQAGSEARALRWVLGSTGEIAGHTEYDKKGDWRLYADPQDRILVAQAADPAGDIDLLGQGRTPGSLLIQRPSGVDNDFSILEYPPQSGAQGTALFAGNGLEAIIQDPVTRLLMGGVTNDDHPRTILFDAALQAKFDKVRRVFPTEDVTLETATTGLDRMVVQTEGPGDSGTYFYVDLAARKVEAIGWAYPTILQEAVGEVRSVTYKAADGLEIQGVLTLPPGQVTKGLPLVVLPHGGPQARDYVKFDWWAQAFASRGYAVFRPNFRGSDGFGKAFRDAGFGQWGRKMQTDISDGVAELAKQGVIDPKRACIVGASYGGYAALAGVTIQKGLYRCAVSVGGVSDLGAMLAYEVSRQGEDSASFRYWRQFMGVTDAAHPALDAISPRRLVEKADAPVLLIYGKDDTVVPNEQSVAFARAMRASGKPVEILELPDEDHWLSREATRVKMLEASVAFVEKYNPPR